MPAIAPVTGTGTAQTGLGGARGYGEQALARSDDGSTRINVSAVFEAGIPYFGHRYSADSLYVNTNGTLSFLSALADYPTAENAQIRRDVIAPFWGDSDTRLDGEGAESGAIWVDVDPTAEVVSVTWDQVGVYRRNAEATNRVQLQLIDRGDGDMDIVMRYEAIGWVSGSAAPDSGARIGLASNRLAEPLWMFDADGAPALYDLPRITGNTGQPGLWVYELRGGTLEGASPGSGIVAEGDGGANLLRGSHGRDQLFGRGGDDTLRGGTGGDLLEGGDGRDLLLGEDGADHILGGASSADLRDQIYGGGGNDHLEGGYGNDSLRGDDGNDTILGGYGVDEVFGGAGDDQLSGQAWSDLIFGGDGMDFINGGYGFDRVNGGAGADRFYHTGDAGHGTDWIQDYTAAQQDVLQFGATASAAQFQVNFARTPDAGTAGVAEAFVIHRPSGQILWALVDGAAQTQILLQPQGASPFDLLG